MRGDLNRCSETLTSKLNRQVWSEAILQIIRAELVL